MQNLEFKEQAWLRLWGTQSLRVERTLDGLLKSAPAQGTLLAESLESQETAVGTQLPTHVGNTVPSSWMTRKRNLGALTWCAVLKAAGSGEFLMRLELTLGRGAYALCRYAAGGARAALVCGGPDADLTVLPGVCFLPAEGSHGEVVTCLCTQAAHASPHGHGGVIIE